MSAFPWLVPWLCQEGILWAGVGAGLFGLFMASTFPLAMSLLSSAGECARWTTPRECGEEREDHLEKNQMRQKEHGRSSRAPDQGEKTRSMGQERKSYVVYIATIDFFVFVVHRCCFFI